MKKTQSIKYLTRSREIVNNKKGKGTCNRIGIQKKGSERVLYSSWLRAS